MNQILQIHLPEEESAQILYKNGHKLKQWDKLSTKTGSQKITNFGSY